MIERPRGSNSTLTGAIADILGAVRREQLRHSAYIGPRITPLKLRDVSANQLRGDPWSILPKGGKSS